ncbi:LysR family transcriptional regulator [Castellaniella hirudinis]|uniref:LysR family transcriptional regulator n=1 Tax=Castellaniella hirudinis TaxID=1144617 RepID=A0ABV8S0E6_9BURK
MDRLTAARVFVTIAERGSLTAAAGAIGMSRAMVTRYLNEMESWVGTRLFHRNTRHVGLTEAGERILGQSRELLALADQLPEPPEDGADMLGVLRITCSQSLAQTLLADVVARFLEQHPESAIDLLAAEHAVDLAAERIDLSVRVTDTLPQDVIARPLGLCRSVICASPGYLARHGTPTALSDLMGHNCLSYTRFGRSLWRFTTPDQTRVDVPVVGNLSANDSMALLAAAIAGVGISMQPRHAVATPIARGELVALLPEFEAPSLGIHAVYVSRRHQTALMRAFLDFTLDCFTRFDVAP